MMAMIKSVLLLGFAVVDGQHGHPPLSHAHVARHKFKSQIQFEIQNA